MAMDAEYSELETKDGLRKRSLILRNQDGNHIEDEPEVKGKYDMVEDFTQNCSMHGIRHIFQDGTGTLYKLFWVILLLSCIGISLLQIVDRVTYYMKWPVTVNLAVNYNSTLLFPAITFCNQNSVRATAAHNAQLYRLMEVIYNEKHNQEEKLEEIQKHGALNTNLEKVFGPVTHSLEDMLISCKWGLQVCGPENFTKIWTSMGLCYTFNSDPTNQLSVISSGSDNGLRLTLNVEEYDYMLNTEGGAGIKVLLHNPQDFPDVKELGFASPSGTHSFIGLKVIELRNLPKPPENCEQEKLEFFNEYSTSTCKLECGTKLMAKICGCRLMYMYMPGKTDKIPVCNLTQYLSCYIKEKEHIMDAQRKCHCPLPCKVLLFEPSVSLATHSDNKIKKLLASKHIKAIEKEFLQAREITERMVHSNMNRMQTLVLNLNHSLNSVQYLVKNVLMQAIDEQLMSIKNVSDSIEALYEFQDFYYGYQTYIVQKNFARVREAMEERTLTYVTFNFYDFIFTLKEWMQILINSEYPHILRKITFIIIRDTINAKIDNLRMALGNFSELHKSLLTGVSIFNYKYKNVHPSHNPYATPTDLLSRRLNRSAEHHTKMPNFLKQMISQMQVFSDILNQTWYTSKFDEELFDNVSSEYMETCINYNGNASVFKFLTTIYAISVIENRQMYLDRRMKWFRQVSSDMTYLLFSLKELLVQLESEAFQNVIRTSENVTDYLLNVNTTKMSLADLLLDEKHANDMNLLSLFYEELRNKDTYIREKWDELAEAAIAVWERVLREVESRKYYEFTNNTHLIRNITEVESEIREEYMARKNDSDLSIILGVEMEDFFMWHDKVLEEVKQFKKSTRMNKKFVSSNLLDVSIFYKQLSYEIITDQEAYGIFALFCDIGGTMGLLLGASVLTLSEVMELAFISSVLVLYKKFFARCGKRGQKVTEV